MKKSKFKLTHLHSATLDAGYLVPFLLQPTLPNDSFRIGLSTFLRAQPMLAPLMHEVYLNTQYWYVPYRLIWEEWEDLITGGNSLSATPVFPTVLSTAEDAKVGSLWDYLGFPLETGVEVSALPFRAIAEIWNTRYRDEDLQAEIPISYASGRDTTTSRKLLSPCISKDYFSVSRPYTQRGADIFVPIVGGESPNSVIHRHVWRFRIFCFDFNESTTTLRYQIMKKNMIGGYITVTPATGGTAIPRTLITEDNFDAVYALVKTNYFNTGSAGRSSFVPPENFSNLCLSLASTLVLGTQNLYSTDKISYEIATAAGPGAATETIFKFENVGFCLMGCTLLSDDTVLTQEPNAFDETPVFRSYLAPNKCDYVGAAKGARVCSGGDIDFYTFTQYVRFSAAGSLSVRSLRESSALQRYAERSLKYGNRYEEFIQREFGISPRDSRIQRPEYLGGGRGLLNISEVLQTAESTDTGVGTMRGHGIGAITQRRIKFRSPEHGLIIGFLSIRPKIVYTQGIDREFLKRSRLDFFTPELANIGMQEVLTQEIYATSSNKGSIFGYSDRYQEYRYHKPLVTGEFRGNLNFWNMALEFANQPELNGEFVNMATYAENWKRPFQIQDNSAHAFVCMLKNHIRAYRPIPKRAKDILK